MRKLIVLTFLCLAGCTKELDDANERIERALESSKKSEAPRFEIEENFL